MTISINGIKSGLLASVMLASLAAPDSLMAEGPSRPAAPVAVQPPVPPTVEVKPVFDARRASNLIDTVNKTIRDSASPASAVVLGLRSALDIRLPSVLEACDINIGHEVLRIAYGVVTDVPDAQQTLRTLSAEFARKDMTEFKGVSSDCAVALKGFGVAVTQVYLGSKWESK